MSIILTLAQINPTVGAVAENTALIQDFAQRAHDEYQADLVVFPELCITGYPPEDLLLRPQFIHQIEIAIEQLQSSLNSFAIVIGAVRKQPQGLFNCAVYISENEIVYYDKQCLPNYGVFDEQRYFTAGKSAGVIEAKGVRLALTVCEDIWFTDPVLQAQQAGAQVILSLNASPYHQQKQQQRQQIVQQRIRECSLPVVYVNQLGGQDELVFDGHSFVMDKSGCVLQMPGFEPSLSSIEIDRAGSIRVVDVAHDKLSELEQLYRALVLATRDYVHKNGFRKVILGLSGGIDSALVLCIAVDALGADQVQAVMMPYRYTSDMSIEDAKRQAETLGVSFTTIPIEKPVVAFREILENEFSGLSEDVTEENLQARSRGVILMALSNKKGAMLLTTGNKSEMSVGYATLYGDMAGGFAPLKDVSKLRVYQLARHLNRDTEVIPQRVIDRPPSAELSPDQKDQDSLPPYEVLDPILEAYIEKDCSVAEIIAQGYAEEVVKRVTWLVDVNEYKRRQAPPGVRVTQRAFGKERRYPITSGFKR